MNAIFADTYYFLALGNSRDEGHRRAVEFTGKYSGRLITTELVLTEVADAIASPLLRPRFAMLRGMIDRDAQWHIVESAHELFERGAELSASRPDKWWSLTDCISFVVMRDRGVADALTADRHFEQAGFNALLAQ